MTLSVVPVPRAMTADAAEPPLRLSDGFVVSGEPDAVARVTTALGARTGLAPAASAGRRVELRIDRAGAPESYRLRVSADGVRIAGADAAGLFYGTQTLLQLLAHDERGWHVPAVDIDDTPRFAYRGAMLDVARHFFPVEVVAGYLDRIASLKLNHLHLHLTDDQGWRLEVTSRPELTRRASASAALGDRGGFYTRADWEAILAYAASRHVTIVPEIDVPSHTHAVGLAYPEVAAEPVITDDVRDTAAQFGGGLPVAGEPYTGFAVGFSSLRTDDERTFAFLADVFGELAAITPGPYLHLGGDEAHGTARDDYEAFIRRTVALVAATGKTPVMWHEAGAVPGLPAGVVAQYWGFVAPTDGSDDAARAVVAAGGRVILSPADAVYLDMKPHADSALGLLWANGPTSLSDAYGWEPTAVVDGLGESDILGVEAPLWTETVRTAADIDALAFPRIAAAAEIAWSPASAELRTEASFRARIAGLWTPFAGEVAR